QHAAATLLRARPPGRRRRADAAVRHETIDVHFSQMPPADHSGTEPMADPVPDRVVAVLMTGHDHARVGPRRVGNAMRLDARPGHGLLAQHVLTLLDGPDRQLEMRCRWRADVNELERSDV